MIKSLTQIPNRKRGPREQGLPNRSPCQRDNVEKMQLWSGNEGVYLNQTRAFAQR